MRNTTTPAESMQLLRRIIGKDFYQLWAKHLTRVQSGSDFIITTSEVNIRIKTGMYEWEVNGEWDDFAYSNIGPAHEGELIEAKSRGNDFKQLEGQIIQDVFIVRQRLECFSRTKGDWRYETDSAFVIVTDSGYLALTQSALHGPILRVDLGENFVPAQIKFFHSVFEDTLEERYQLSRKLISLATGNESEMETEG
jgi:hypothetical protein